MPIDGQHQLPVPIDGWHLLPVPISRGRWMPMPVDGQHQLPMSMPIDVGTRWLALDEVCLLPIASCCWGLTVASPTLSWARLLCVHYPFVHGLCITDFSRCIDKSSRCLHEPFHRLPVSHTVLQVSAGKCSLVSRKSARAGLALKTVAGADKASKK